MKEDINQELMDISEYTYVRLRMHQRSIGSLEKSMQVMANAKEIMKDKWTRADEAIRTFIGTWFQMSKEDVDTFYPKSSYLQPY